MGSTCFLNCSTTAFYFDMNDHCSLSLQTKAQRDLNTVTLINQHHGALTQMKHHPENKPVVFNVNEVLVPEDIGTVGSRLAYFSNLAPGTESGVSMERTALMSRHIGLFLLVIFPGNFLGSFCAGLVFALGLFRGDGAGF